MKRIAIILAALLMLFTCACTMRIPGSQGSGGQVFDPFAQAERTAAPVFASEAPAPTESPLPEGMVTFSGVDVNGDPISLADFASAKVIMINFFETWCPPCMGELPDLETIYEQYKDRGLVILGVYSSSDNASILSTISSIGITYPVLPCTPTLAELQTEYVPTTVFINARGEKLLDEPCIGSRDLAGWESVILPLLQNAE